MTAVWRRGYLARSRSVCAEGEAASVRPASPADHGQCLAILNAALAAPDEDPAIRPILSAGDFSRETAGEDILVAVTATGAVLGFVTVARPDRFIHHLYVDPPHRRLGIGRRLLAAAIEALGGQASLKVLDANRAAVAFYRALGGAAGERGIGPDGAWTRMHLGEGPPRHKRLAPRLYFFRTASRRFVSPGRQR